MKIVHTISEVRDIIKAWRKEGKTVGFVPTMGYLHEGHQSLMQKSVEENDYTVVSIFVNPMQFAPTEDLESYPRDLERDAKICEETGADLIFNPEPEEMYGPHFSAYVDINGLSEGLCGKTRPIHFRGVCTVVSKLFHIVLPDKAYFGQKDAQQLAIIRQMVSDLNMPIEIVGCPIIREADGLAKSSRNTYLSAEERQAALVLSKSLEVGKALISQGVTKSSEIEGAIRAILDQEPLAKVDYIEIVDGVMMIPIEEVSDNTLIAIAVYIGKTRLIDNFIVEG